KVRITAKPASVVLRRMTWFNTVTSISALMEWAPSNGKERDTDLPVQPRLSPLTIALPPMRSSPSTSSARRRSRWPRQDQNGGACNGLCGQGQHATHLQFDLNSAKREKCYRLER